MAHTNYNRASLILQAVAKYLETTEKVHVTAQDVARNITRPSGVLFNVSSNEVWLAYCLLATHPETQARRIVERMEYP